MEGYSVIGRLGTPHGTDGQLKAYFNLEWDNMEKGFVPFEAFFIEDNNGLPLPFFIESFQITGDEAILQLEEVNSKEAALEIGGRLLYLPASMVEEETDELAQYAYLEGYQLYDHTLGPIGQIEEVYVLPMQEVAQLTFKGRELLVPLNEDFILDIDDNQQVIRMDLPEGLTQLNDHED